MKARLSAPQAHALNASVPVPLPPTEHSTQKPSLSLLPPHPPSLQLCSPPPLPPPRPFSAPFLPTSPSLPLVPRSARAVARSRSSKACWTLTSLAASLRLLITRSCCSCATTWYRMCSLRECCIQCVLLESVATTWYKMCSLGECCIQCVLLESVATTW